MDTATTTIITTTLTTIGSIAVAFITTKRNQALRKENDTLNEANQQLESKIREVKLVSTGMVVAYFFSFIRPLFQNIASSTLVIVDGDKEYRLYKENTKLELFIPKSLDKESLEEVNKFYRSMSGIGAIMNGDGLVLYKQINYRITVRESAEAIILIDLPAILSSALKYYKIPLYGHPSDLKEILDKEMSNFRSEIIRMIENEDLDDSIVIHQYS
jgi:hypothetical protein